MSQLTDERILVGVLHVEGHEVEESDEACSEDRPVLEEASGNERQGSNLGFIVDESDENDWSKCDHSDDLIV